MNLKRDNWTNDEVIDIDIIEGCMIPIKMDDAMNWKCKVFFKEIRKIPKGVTTLYGIKWYYDMSKPVDIIYSKTVSNTGKTSIYAGYSILWKIRKYKDYTDIDSNRLSKTVYEEMELAVKKYEDQLT